MVPSQVFRRFANNAPSQCSLPGRIRVSAFGRSILALCAAIVLCAGSQPAFSQTPNIYTVAGSGAGSGLQRMGQAVADSHGDVYVADGAAFRVVKVTNPMGATPDFTVIAGTGVRGLNGDGGPAVSAQLQAPCAVALDAVEAYLYIADGCGDPAKGRVRRVDLNTGLITLVASGFNPQSIAIDSHNNIFVADGSDIFKIVSGTVSTFYSSASPLGIFAYVVAIDRTDASDTVYFSGFGAASGVIARVPNTNGTPGTPSKIAGADNCCWNGSPVLPLNMNMDFSPVLVASGGYIYFNSQLDQRIGRFARDGSGTVQLIAGNGSNSVSGDGGLAINAGIGNGDVYGMAVAGSNVFFGGNTQLMRYFTLAGNIHSVNAPGNPTYQGDNGPATSATISNNVMKVAFDAGGNMYIADQGNRVVRKVNATTNIITTAVTGAQLDTGLGGTHVGNFNITNDAAGSIYIATDTNGLFKLAGGTFTRVALAGAFSANPLRDIAYNPVDGLIYVLANSNVDKIKTDGTNRSTPYWGTGVSRLSLAIDSAGNVWATQASGAMLNTLSLDKLPATGTHVLANIGTQAVATYPVAGDPRGGVVYMDNFAAKSLNSGGTTIAGQPGTKGFSGDNGPATSSELSSALGLAFDKYCNLYISDSENQRIRKVENLVTATVGPNQGGLDLSVDAVDGGGSITWVSGTQHTLSTTTPQYVAGTKYIFSRWSLPGNQTSTSISTTVTAPCASGTYTAIFITPPTIAMSFGAASVPVGGSTSLSFTINNPNANDPLSGIALTDNLPGGLIVAAPNGVTGSCGGGTISATAGSSSVSLSGAALPANSSCTFSVNVMGALDGVQTNTTGNISSTETGAGNTASANLTVINPPAVSTAFGAANIPLNGTTSLTFTLTSTNVNLTLNGVTFADSLPAGLVVATPGNLVTTCGGTAIAADGSSTVSLTGAGLAPGASCQIALNVKGTTAGPKNNSVTVNSSNGGPSTPSNASVTVVAPPVIVKAFGVASIPLNNSTSLSFTIQNNNPAGTLHGIGFTDPLPAGLVISTPNGLTGNCGTTTATAGTNVIDLAGATLSAGGSCTFSINVTGIAAGTQNNVTGNVTSTEGGTGGTASASIQVIAPPSIAIVFNPSTIALNTTTSLTFTITNPAANVVPLTGVGFTDTLPAGLTVANASATVCGGTVTTTAPNGIALSGATIAANSQCQFSVTVTGAVPDNNYTSATGNVTSTNGGTGNTAAASLTVVGPPTVTTAFGSVSGTIPLNGVTSLTFNITNPNTGVPLTGLAFTNNLPTGLVIAPAPNLNSTCGGATTAVAGASTATLSGGTLASGAACAISVDVQGVTAGVKNNGVVVTSTEGGTGNTANALVTVVAPAALIKAFGAASIPLNGSTSLSFTVTNSNTTTALTGVGFTDTLPAGLVVSTPNGLTGNCGTITTGTNVIVLAGATISASSSCTFSVNVTGIAAGAQNNLTGNVTSTEGGTGGTASASIDVVAPPAIMKAFNPATISLNATTSLSFTLTNPAGNSVALTSVAFTDTLPNGLTVASASATVCGGTLTTTAPNGIALSGATIAINSQCQFSVTVTGAASGNYTNTTGNVSSANGGTGNSATANLTVAAAPTITTAFGAAHIPLSDTTSLDITITNPNPGVALTGLAFTDNLPAGLVIAATPNLNSSCGTVTALAGSSSASLSGGSLAAGASCIVSMDVQGVTAGVKNTSVAVTSTEGGTGNTANASVTVVAPAALIKAFGAASIPLNGSTSLSFTVTNSNTTTALTGVGFTDTLPAGLVVSTPNGLTGNCGTITTGTNVISLAGATISASSSCTFSVNVTGIAAGAQNNLTGNVTSTEGGTGGTASASVNAIAPPSIAIVFNPSTIAPNAVTALTFTITNPAANTVAETGVAFNNPLPANLVVATPNGLSSTCNGTVTAVAGAGGISLAGGSIATPNTSCTVIVSVTSAASGNYTNTTGNVSSANGGTGNSATANLSVASPPTITTAFGATTIPLNGSTSLAFTVTNPNTGGILTGIAFTDNLPAGLVIASTPTLSSTCGGTATVAGSGSVSLSGGTLATNASCTVSLNVTGTTPGVKNNTTGVISAIESGPGTTSNTATLTVVAPPVISGSFGGASIPLAGATSLNFSISNPNPGNDLTGVAFTDVLPAGLVLSTPNGLTGTCGGGAITAAPATNNLSLAGATLAAGGSCTFSVSVTGVHAGAQVNTSGNVTSVNGGSGGAATASLTVNQASTTTTVVSAGTKHVGEAATFTATVSSTAGTPTGTVVFLEGSTTLGSATLTSGVATFSASSLTTGTHSITAQYQGNSDYIGSVSAAVSQQVTTPLLTITAGSTSLTIPAGQSGTVQLTISSAGGLSAPVTLSCSGLPVGSQCAFSPASVGPTGLPAQVTLTLTTTRFKLVGQNIPSRLPWTFAMLLPGLCLLPFAGKHGKHRLLQLILGFSLLLSLLLCAGCGGGSAASGVSNAQQSTTPGTYTVTVTATSTGVTQASTNLNLTVTP